jgi:hypothetical protein
MKESLKPASCEREARELKARERSDKRAVYGAGHRAGQLGETSPPRPYRGSYEKETQTPRHFATSTPRHPDTYTARPRHPDTRSPFFPFLPEGSMVRVALEIDSKPMFKARERSCTLAPPMSSGCSDFHVGMRMMLLIASIPRFTIMIV